MNPLELDLPPQNRTLGCIPWVKGLSLTPLIPFFFLTQAVDTLKAVHDHSESRHSVGDRLGMILGCWSWAQFHAVALQCVRGGWGNMRCDDMLHAYLALPMEDYRGVRQGLSHQLLNAIDDLLRGGAAELETEDLDLESRLHGSQGGGA